VIKSIRLMAAALALVATASFAASSVSLDTSGLTEAQIADLKIQALKMQQQQKSDATPAVTTVTQGAQQVSTAALQEAEKWTNFGKNLGSAMVSTAKELGVAVNDFSKTDIGKITTAIIVYKLVGSQVTHFIAGLILMFLLPSLIIGARRYMTVEGVKYEYQDRSLFGILPYKKKVIVQIDKVGGDNAFWIFFWTCVLTLASILFSLWIMLGG
jgi:hypothetical protein